MNFIQRIRTRFKLKVVVKTFPHLMKYHFGEGKFHKPANVKMLVEILKFDEERILYAYSIACRKSDFLKVMRELNEDDYLRLREDICRLYGCDESELTCNYFCERFPFKGSLDIQNPGNDKYHFDVNPSSFHNKADYGNSGYDAGD